MTDPAVDTLFAAAASGDREARQQIFAAVYGELRRLAKRELRRQGPGVGISPTTLLHEAYLGFGARTGIVFPDRARFMAYACRAMRGLILDYARERMAQKRGAGVEITSFKTGTPEAGAGDLELTAVGDALEELAQRDPPLAEIVDLRFFCGLTFPEIAALRGVSERTVQRDWEKARLLLFRSMRTEEPR